VDCDRFTDAFQVQVATVGCSNRCTPDCFALATSRSPVDASEPSGVSGDVLVGTVVSVGVGDIVGVMVIVEVSVGVGVTALLTAGK